MNKGVLIFLSLLLSCNTKEDRETKCNTDIKRFYAISGTGENGTSYMHDLVVFNYDEESFDDYRFVEFAYKYIDTVVTDTPVGSIMFYKPTNEVKNAPKNSKGLFNGVESKSAYIFSIGFDDKTVRDSFPQIRSLTFWQNGESFSVDLSKYSNSLKELEKR